jgi:hypothetical protein
MGSSPIALLCSLRARALAALALIAAAAVAAAPGAKADPPPPASVNQYVEQIPTGSGSAAVGATKKGVKKLPKKTAAKITKQGGTDSALLKKVATAEDYGAPQTSLSPQAAPTTTQQAPVVTPKAKPKPKPKPKPKVVVVPKQKPVTTPKPTLTPPPAHANASSDDDRSAVAAGFDAATSDGRMLLLIAVVLASSLAVAGARAVRRGR